MQIIRKSTAIWNGTGKEGTGHLSTQSGILNQTQYGFNSRFASGAGTNPEELVAAAHAGCFSMKLAFNLQAQGVAADEIATSCEIVFENGAITASKLTVHVKAAGIENDKFQELVTDAEKNCPISKVLNTQISVVATLNA